jgi:hypothetical protein
MAKKKPNEDRDRLAASLAASLPDSGGGYQVSSAFSAPERRRFLGTWAIAEHTVEGRPYVEAFAAHALRGAAQGDGERGAPALLDPVYAAVYDFRDSICVKKVQVSGIAELPGGRAEYSYRMSVAISWELGRGFLIVRPELGYQSTSLDGKPAAVKELARSGESARINYRFEGEQLVLEEGSDFKRLTREG